MDCQVIVVGEIQYVFSVMSQSKEVLGMKHGVILLSPVRHTFVATGLRMYTNIKQPVHKIK